MAGSSEYSNVPLGTMNDYQQLKTSVPYTWNNLRQVHNNVETSTLLLDTTTLYLLYIMVMDHYSCTK